MELTAEDITKGRAGDMITKIKFGARGRFERIKSVVRKQEKQEEKRDRHKQMVAREQVRVGPITEV